MKKIKNASVKFGIALLILALFIAMSYVGYTIENHYGITINGMDSYTFTYHFAMEHPWYGVMLVVMLVGTIWIGTNMVYEEFKKD